MEVSKIKDLVRTLKAGFSKGDSDGYGKFIYFVNDRIMSYNGEISVVAQIENVNAEFALPFVEFEKFINRVKGKEITITVDTEVTIKCGRAKAHFKIDSEAIKKIKELTYSPGDMKPLPSNFIEGLQLVGHSFGMTKDIPYTQFVSIKNNIMFSTNNWTVSRYEFTENVDDMIIPKKIVPFLIKEKFDSYVIVKGLAYFRTVNKVFFVVRLSDEEMPDIEEYFEMEGQVFEFPNDMIDVVTTAEVAVDALNLVEKIINIKVKDGLLTCESKSDDLTIDVECECESDVDFDIDTGSRFLADILGLTNKVYVDTNKLLFKTDNFKHIVVLFDDN